MTTDGRNGDACDVAETSRPLGPWLRLYADVVDRKAHYDDHQFRSLIEVLALAVRLHGVLPSRRALEAREGTDEIDFLFSEGDLEETPDGAVVVHRWRSYQPDPTGAERQRRFRSNARLPLQAVTSNATPSDSASDSASSSSSSTEENVERAVPSAEPLLDALMESQGSVPSKNAMEWAERLASEYGEDATIRALGWAATTGPVKVISRAEAHLKEQALRRDRSDAKRKSAELERARTDRIAARRAEPGPADPRPLADIIRGLTP